MSKYKDDRKWRPEGFIIEGEVFVLFSKREKTKSWTSKIMKILTEEVLDIGNGIQSIDKTLSFKKGEKEYTHKKHQTGCVCVCVFWKLL